MTKQKEEEEKIKEKNLENLYERRHFLDVARVKHSDSLDKYLLTFSTGSLYLSISFTNNLEGPFFCKNVLSTGWILFWRKSP